MHRLIRTIRYVTGRRFGPESRSVDGLLVPPSEPLPAATRTGSRQEGRWLAAFQSTWHLLGPSSTPFGAIANK